MILSHKYKCIFIHIGKTGGTSIERALGPLINMDFEETKYNHEVISNIDKLNYTPRWATNKDHTGRINCKHIRASELRQITGDKIWNKYYKFAFVRNPYDRLLSEYSMVTQFDVFKSHPWNKYLTFEEFLDAVVSGNQFIGGNSYNKYLTDWKGKLLVDFVGKIESLQADFNKICEKLGIEKTELPHTGPTKHRPFEEYYTPKRMEMIYRINNKDFKMFGYSRDIKGIDPVNCTEKLHINMKYYHNALKYKGGRVIHRIVK